MKAPLAEGLLLRSRWGCCQASSYQPLHNVVSIPAAGLPQGQQPRVRKQVPKMKAEVFSYPHLRNDISSLLQGSAHQKWVTPSSPHSGKQTTRGRSAWRWGLPGPSLRLLPHKFILLPWSYLSFSILTLVLSEKSYLNMEIKVNVKCQK